MPKLELSMENFASEQDLEKAIQQASNAMSSEKAATKAKVVRDGNGKLVSVTVGLPQNATAQERTAARDAVLASNPGVGSASALPIEIFEDFDAETPGNAVPASLTIDDQVISILKLGSTNGADVRYATAAESVGAAGSAVEFYDILPVDNTSIGGAIRWEASNNDLTLISGYVCEFDVRSSSIGNEGTTHSNRVFVDGPQKQAGGNFGLISEAGFPNWFLLNNIGGAQDTGISKESFIHCKYSVSPTGLVTMEAGAVSTSRDFGFPQSSTSAGVQVLVSDLGIAGAQKSMIIDNFSLIITDL